MNQQKVQVVDADFAGIFFKPIAHYLSDPNTSEVMVNAPDDIWVEGSKGLFKAPETFTPESLEAAVNSLAQYVGRPIIENVFSIDARMPDGSRVAIVLPPVSGSSPIFAIRIFKGVITDLDYLVKQGSMTKEMVALLAALVRVKENLMVAGGTSSGKTTLLNLLAATIPNEERIITIEDSRELQLKQEHVLALEARPADKHGKGEFTIRQCLKSSLRLRPDRIVVGEIRGGEAFDLLMAMNTGHGGCMGTVHANTPTDTLRRIESLALMADVDMPLVAIRSIIASTLNVIVSPARLSDGSRRIINIAEVGPLTEKGDYQTFDMVRYVTTNRNEATGKLSGYFEFTGYVPSFFDHFVAEGVKVPRDFFRKRIIGNVSPEVAEQKYQEGYEVYNLDGAVYKSANPRRVVDDFKIVTPAAPFQQPNPAPAPISPAPIPPEPPAQAKEVPTPLVPEPQPKLDPELIKTHASVEICQEEVASPLNALAQHVGNQYSQQAALDDAFDEPARIVEPDHTYMPEAEEIPQFKSSQQADTSEPAIDPSRLIRQDTSDLHDAFDRITDDSLSPMEKLGRPSHSFEEDEIPDTPQPISALGKMFQAQVPQEPVPQAKVATGSNPYEVDDEVSALRSQFEEFEAPGIDPEILAEQARRENEMVQASQSGDRPSLLSRLRQISEADQQPAPPSEPDYAVSSAPTRSEPDLPLSSVFEQPQSQEPERAYQPPVAEPQPNPDPIFFEPVMPSPQVAQQNEAATVPAGQPEEHITQAEGEASAGNQHVVIAEILRRMRENRGK
ncbi:MAG: ATPase, T2SS/T4P/T4SS family [Candidatus Caenarcaniphilales bacterium]|nr:ATPase, T2SS/T4P/T4SS family [Candidatus Caenarcaniphilales bacterium]